MATGEIMSTLSTHVLDTTLGVPAANIAFTLSRGDDLLFSAATGLDGRWRCPEELEQGTYRLRFDIASYFKARSVRLADPPFFAVISIDFAVPPDGGHYHVPLLVSPYGYSTYRGS